MENILIRTQSLAEAAKSCHRRGSLCFWLSAPRPPGEVFRPDNRTDIYCIGSILFSALILRADGSQVPYQPAFYRIIGDMLAGSLIWESGAAPVRQELETSLGNILRQCLAPRPQGRYSCCEELLADLDQVIAVFTALQRFPP